MKYEDIPKIKSLSKARTALYVLLGLNNNLATRLASAEAQVSKSAGVIEGMLAVVREQARNGKH